MTNGEICNLALRMMGLIRLGGSLSAGQSTQALEGLKNLTLSLPGVVMGYPWIDVVGVDGYVAGEDERVMCATAMTITLPDYVEFDGTGSADAFDEDTLRVPLDGARVQIVTRSTGATALHFFRSDIGDWVEATYLAAANSPFNAATDEYLAAMLAYRLSNRPNVDLSEATIQCAAEGRRHFAGRYRRPSAPLASVYF